MDINREEIKLWILMEEVEGWELGWFFYFW